MAGWIKGAVVLAGVVAGGAATVATVGNRNWNRSTARVVQGLGARNGAGRSDGRPPAAGRIPDAVARYFGFVLTPGGPTVRAARVEHAGEFRTGGAEAGWRPFRSVQHFTADPPGFVWDASINMAPLLNVRVRDSYVGGQAAMLGKIAGVVPVVDQQGTPELAAGALSRWLAEAVWFPTALLPRPGLAWESIDDRTARATLVDSGVTVSMDCRFAADGGIERITADRYRDVDGVGVLTPWLVELRDYRWIDGMRIPMSAEVAWLLPDGKLSYWRGRVERIEYEPRQ